MNFHPKPDESQQFKHKVNSMETHSQTVLPKFKDLRAEEFVTFALRQTFLGDAPPLHATLSYLAELRSVLLSRALIKGKAGRNYVNGFFFPWRCY